MSWLEEWLPLRWRTHAPHGQYLTEGQRDSGSGIDHTTKIPGMQTTWIEKFFSSSYSRTCIGKGLTHLAIVTLPASWIFVSSTKPFRADFTRTEKAIMTPAFLWHFWNKQHTWAVELKQYYLIPIFIFLIYLQSHSKNNLTHSLLLRCLLWCYILNNFSIYKHFLHWIGNISEY